jgi:tripartite ATP-independent transporter DctP family solute receptor
MLRRSLPLLVAGVIVGAAQGALAETTLRIASEEPFGDPPKVAAQYGLEYLEEHLPEETGGEVTAQLYSGGALGSEKELIKSVGTGTVDATVLSPGNAAGLIPEVQLFSASYLFNSFDHAREVLSSDEFFDRLQEIVREKDLGFQLAGLALSGTRNFYNNVKPVSGIDDLKGMKMRVMSSPTEFEVWSTLGTLPTNIPAPEIYTSIQTGVVDAAESSLPAIVGNKYYEVAPNIALTQHQFNLHLYLISDQALERIPEEHREAVMQAFRQAGLVQIDAAEKLTGQTLAFLREQQGVTVTEVNTQPFAEKLEPIQDKVAEDLGVEDLLQMIREAA